MVGLIHNLDLQNMYMQYKSNQNSVRTYQAYKQVTLTYILMSQKSVTVEHIQDCDIEKMCTQYEINQSSS